MMTNKVSIASCLQTAARPYLSYHLVCGVGSTHKVVVFRQSHVPTCLKITLFFQITDCYVPLSCASYIIRCKATAVLFSFFFFSLEGQGGYGGVWEGPPCGALLLFMYATKAYLSEVMYLWCINGVADSWTVSSDGLRNYLPHESEGENG